MTFKLIGFSCVGFVTELTMMVSWPSRVEATYVPIHILDKVVVIPLKFLIVLFSPFSTKTCEECT